MGEAKNRGTYEARKAMAAKQKPSKAIQWAGIAIIGALTAWALFGAYKFYSAGQQVLALAIDY